MLFNHSTKTFLKYFFRTYLVKILSLYFLFIRNVHVCFFFLQTKIRTFLQIGRKSRSTRCNFYFLILTLPVPRKETNEWRTHRFPTKVERLFRTLKNSKKYNPPVLAYLCMKNILSCKLFNPPLSAIFN